MAHKHGKAINFNRSDVRSDINFNLLRHSAGPLPSGPLFACAGPIRVCWRKCKSRAPKESGRPSLLARQPQIQQLMKANIS